MITIGRKYKICLDTRGVSNALYEGTLSFIENDMLSFCKCKNLNSNIIEELKMTFNIRYIVYMECIS